jgi:hypothetical protein
MGVLSWDWSDLPCCARKVIGDLVVIKLLLAWACPLEGASLSFPRSPLVEIRAFCLRMEGRHSIPEPAPVINARCPVQRYRKIYGQNTIRRSDFR